MYDEGLLQDTEEGHSSPVYDQVPERDEYIDNKTIMLAKVDSQQVYLFVSFSRVGTSLAFSQVIAVTQDARWPLTI